MWALCFGEGELQENTPYRIIISNVTTGTNSLTYVGGSFTTGNDD